MKCLIIAAGQGSRLRQRAESKPLVPVLGTPLIERVIRTALAGGADEFYVVSGYQGPRLRHHLDEFAARDGVVIHHVVNERWAEPNGLSVLQAAQYIREPFLLLMSDHLFDPTIVRDVLRHPPELDGVVLAVDSRIDNPAVDLSDVTRVYHEQGRIRDIGKGLERFNAFDTGIFYCSPVLFTAIEDSMEQRGDASLSGGVRMLAARQTAKVFDIGGRFWLDVDDSRAYVKAEVALIESLDQVAAPDLRSAIA